MATHSRILAWRIPWTEEPKGYSPWGHKELDMTKQLTLHFNPEYSLEDWCWRWSSNTLATWCEEPTHWKGLWCWEKLRAGVEGGDRGRDGWMASLIQWIWVWANSRKKSITGKPGVLQSMGLQSLTWLSNWAAVMSGRAWRALFVSFLLFITAYELYLCCHSGNSLHFPGLILWKFLKILSIHVLMNTWLFIPNVMHRVNMF